MTERSEPEWTDDDFIPREEQDPLERLRDDILRQIVQGVPRDEVEEELVKQGYRLEYAIALVDSVKRSPRRAERRERILRALTEASAAPHPELIFGKTPAVSQPDTRSQRAAIPGWVFIRGGILLLLVAFLLLDAVVLYWLATKL
jgi:hypothetical protein